MKTLKLCQNCFFYEFISKHCATGHKMPLKKEKCRFFERRVVVTIYYENTNKHQHRFLIKHKKPVVY